MERCAGQPSVAHDINSLVIDLNTLVPAGAWDLQEATSINDSGQIAATGSLNGQPAPFLGTVPQ